MNLLSQMKNIVRPQSLRRKLLRIVQALSTNVLELHSTIAHLQAQASERSAAIAHLQAEASERSAAIAHLQAENVQFKLGHHFAPGHFYSTIPNLEEVRRYHDVIFNRLPRQLPGIDLNEAGQVQLYEEFLQYLDDADFPRDKRPGLRYYSENGWYPFGDAIFLYAMMRHHKPTRIIEVGSGFSSCVILDTNERFFQNRIRCTFIEPEPERFLRAIHPEDKERVDLVAGDVRDLTPEYFQCLSAGDILLIDSSHVSKVHSDVNWLMFEVLPALRSGVLVHFHDIWYPFRYPEKWVYEGWAWNESYLLRAFLQYNSAFQIAFFNSMWIHFHLDRLQAELPRILENGGSGSGGSIWLRKI